MAKKTPDTEIKARIYNAARRLFVEKGYYQTSIPDIVKEAGVSIGAIYHHFSSKEDLARVIHQDALAQFLDRYDRYVESVARAEEKVRGFVRFMFEWADEDLIMVNYLLHGRPQEILEYNFTICSAEGLEAVKKIVVTGIEEGTFKKGDEVLMAAFISGPIMRLIELKTDGIITAPLSSLAEETAEYILAALKA